MKYVRPPIIMTLTWGMVLLTNPANAIDTVAEIAPLEPPAAMPPARPKAYFADLADGLGAYAMVTDRAKRDLIACQTSRQKTQAQAALEANLAYDECLMTLIEGMKQNDNALMAKAQAFTDGIGQLREELTGHQHAIEDGQKDAERRAKHTVTARRAVDARLMELKRMAQGQPEPKLSSQAVAELRKLRDEVQTLEFTGKITAKGLAELKRQADLMRAQEQTLTAWQEEGEVLRHRMTEHANRLDSIAWLVRTGATTNRIAEQYAGVTEIAVTIGSLFPEKLFATTETWDSVIDGLGNQAPSGIPSPNDLHDNGPIVEWLLNYSGSE